MPNIGPLELGIVLLIVLLVFGPKKLPGLGKQLGSGMREFKDSLTGSSKDDDHDDDERPALKRATSTEAAPVKVTSSSDTPPVTVDGHAQAPVVPHDPQS